MGVTDTPNADFCQLEFGHTKVGGQKVGVAKKKSRTRKYQKSFFDILELVKHFQMRFSIEKTSLNINRVLHICEFVSRLLKLERKSLLRAAAGFREKTGFQNQFCS